MADDERTIEVHVEVSANCYDASGQLTGTMGATAKLTKADAGRSAAKDEDMLSIKLNGSGPQSAAIDYNGSATSTGDDAMVSTEIELEVKGQTMDMTRGELIDAVASAAKLTKADAGRMLNETSETWLNLEANAGVAGDAPKITTRSHSKLTKADAGRETA